MTGLEDCRLRSSSSVPKRLSGPLASTNNGSEFRLFDRRIEKDLRKIFDRKKQLESSNVDPVMRIEEMQKLSEAEELLFDTFNKRFREATK